MFNKPTTIFLVVLIGSLTTTVAGHLKNKEHKLAGNHHHLLGTRGEGCPQGTRLVFSSSSPGLLAGNFAARCEPSDTRIASPFTPPNSLVQSNTAFNVPNFQQSRLSSAALKPSDIFRPLSFLPGAVVGHQSMGVHRAAFPAGLLLKERTLHKTLGSKLARHAMKHSLNKSKF